MQCAFSPLTAPVGSGRVVGHPEVGQEPHKLLCSRPAFTDVPALVQFARHSGRDPHATSHGMATDIVRYRSSCAGLMPRLRQLFSSGGRFTRSGVNRFAPILHLRSKLGSVAGHAPSAGTGQTNPLSLVGLRTDAMKPIVTSLGGSWSAGSHRRLSAPTTLPRWR